MARFSVAAVRAAAATPIDPLDPARGGVRIRVGLHSGPCSAGVVGRQCPKYTLYGDTINVAARMEQSGAPGRVQCTAFTAALVRAQDPAAVLRPRGAVEVKGKGAMQTCWIVAAGGEALDDDGEGEGAGDGAGTEPDGAGSTPQQEAASRAPSASRGCAAAHDGGGGGGSLVRQVSAALLLNGVEPRPPALYASIAGTASAASSACL
jgi:hypothetical protein